jgi:hypothetical protein
MLEMKADGGHTARTLPEQFPGKNVRDRRNLFTRLKKGVRDRLQERRHTRDWSSKPYLWQQIGHDA